MSKIQAQSVMVARLLDLCTYCLLVAADPLDRNLYEKNPDSQSYNKGPLWISGTYELTSWILHCSDPWQHFCGLPV
jgi:hypothetical protein